MRLGDDEAEVAPATAWSSRPDGHKLWNRAEPLVLLCCCAPAYSDETRS